MTHKLFFILLVSFAITGCFSGGRKDPNRVSGNLPPIEAFQAKAAQYEKKDELQLALANWRIAEKLIIDKINALTDHIDNQAEKHFQKGLTLYNAGLYSLAELEFVKTLSYDREHRAALNYLKKQEDFLKNHSYIVQKGDTFASVAKKIYKNGDMAYIVRYFSGRDLSEALIPGTKLTLPVLEVSFTRLFFNLKKELQVARDAFSRHAYESVLTHSETILRHDPNHSEALYMKNTAFFRLGEKYFHDEKYQEAIKLLKQIDKYYRNVKSEIAEVKDAFTKKKNETAEYENNRLYHQGMALYKEKNYLEALDALMKISPGYANVGDVVKLIRADMKEEAAIHYRNGVKFFVNENLKEAIEEWELALKTDPENETILRDIENARNLLDKIDKVD